MKQSHKALAIQDALDQLKWIEDHGGCEAGYVARYGPKNHPDHYGNGGEAIWAADYAEYQRLWFIVKTA